jgi:hypothetical protein
MGKKQRPAVVIDETLIAANHATALRLQGELFALMGADVKVANFSLLQSFWPSASTMVVELLPRFEALVSDKLPLEARDRVLKWLYDGGYAIAMELLASCAQVVQLGSDVVQSRLITQDLTRIRKIGEEPLWQLPYGRGLAMPLTRMVFFLYYYDVYEPAVNSPLTYALPQIPGPEVLTEMFGMFDDLLGMLRAY